MNEALLGAKLEPSPTDQAVVPPTGVPSESAPVNAEPLAVQLAVPVDPVQREERHRGRVRAPVPRARQLLAEGAPDRARKPLVEVAHHHARTGEIGVEDVLAHQPRHLRRALADAQAEVDVEEVEQALGRVRPPGTPEAQRYEPRPLDIDILLYGDQVIAVSDALHVPHLLMHERGFVLRPLADLAPDVEHPVLYQTIRELVAALDDEHEVRVSDLPRRWFDR